jgi:hypothetical protein
MGPAAPPTRVPLGPPRVPVSDATVGGSYGSTSQQSIHHMYDSYTEQHESWGVTGTTEDGRKPNKAQISTFKNLFKMSCYTLDPKALYRLYEMNHSQCPCPKHQTSAHHCRAIVATSLTQGLAAADPTASPIVCCRHKLLLLLQPLCPTNTHQHAELSHAHTCRPTHQKLTVKGVSQVCSQSGAVSKQQQAHTCCVQAHMHAKLAHTSWRSSSAATSRSAQHNRSMQESTSQHGCRSPAHTALCVAGVTQNRASALFSQSIDQSVKTSMPQQQPGAGACS